MAPRLAVTTLLRVCWLTALACSSSCRVICRLYSLKNSRKNMPIPIMSISTKVRVWMTRLARRMDSSFRLGFWRLVGKFCGIVRLLYGKAKARSKKSASYSLLFASLYGELS